MGLLVGKRALWALGAVLALCAAAPAGDDVDAMRRTGRVVIATYDAAIGD